ncbi:MAG: hypothetical protein ACK4R2_08745 [Roseateles sp.]
MSTKHWRPCSAEHRVHLGPSGLWTHTTRADTVTLAGFKACMTSASAHCHASCGSRD